MDSFDPGDPIMKTDLIVIGPIYNDLHKSTGPFIFSVILYFLIHLSSYPVLD